MGKSSMLSLVVAVSLLACSTVEAGWYDRTAFEMAVVEQRNENSIWVHYPQCMDPRCEGRIHRHAVAAGEIREVTLTDGRRVSTRALIESAAKPRVALLVYGKRQIPKVYLQSVHEHVLVIRLQNRAGEVVKNGMLYGTDPGHGPVPPAPSTSEGPRATRAGEPIRWGPASVGKVETAAPAEVVIPVVPY